MSDFTLSVGIWSVMQRKIFGHSANRDVAALNMLSFLKDLP
ncbi:hypothetical protein SAMN04488030_0862 [Aliiroseovarius halocynthiae]|nr:hypothetical protein SAMN04488030_0862 [Aliiroseovarius halocynthiae]